MEFLAAQGLRALKDEMQAFVDHLTAAGVVWPARKGVVGTPRRSELGDQGVAQGHDAQRSEGALRGRARARAVRSASTTATATGSGAGRRALARWTCACRGSGRAATSRPSWNPARRRRRRPLIRYVRLAVGRSVRPAELTDLIEALLADASPAGIRDTAILGILYAGGLRRGELAGLTLADGNVDADGARTCASSVWATASARSSWNPVRRRRSATGCTFAASGREPSSAAFPKPASSSTRNSPCRRYPPKPSTTWCASAPGPPGCGPRFPRTNFRRTLLTHLLKRGRDVFTVQAIDGDGDPATTQRYDRGGENHVREAAYAVHFPYGGREGRSSD